MLFRLITPLYLSLCLSLVFSSCVGKKKHLEAIKTLETQHQNELQSKTQNWTRQLNDAQDNIMDLTLQLAERKGENNALTALQDKLEGRIESLKQDLENQGLQSQSNSQNLSSQVQQRDQEIAHLEDQLKQVDDALKQNLTQLGVMVNDLRMALATLPSEEYDITTSNTRVKVIFSEKLLFKRNSTSTVSSETNDILAAVAGILLQHPSMDMIVMGHTDNRPPRNKGYKDNWNVSSIRAAIITRLFVEDHDVSPNQILAAGKGEFAPRTSNETSEGRANNRRIELWIQPRQENILRSVQQILEQ